MRSGQETRKRTRQREFLEDLMRHAKEFHEFHKKRLIQIKKKGLIFKNSLEQRKKREVRVKVQED